MQVWLLMSITLILSVSGETCVVDVLKLQKLADQCLSRGLEHYLQVDRKYCDVVCNGNTFPEVVGPRCSDVTPSGMSQDLCNQVVHQSWVVTDKRQGSTQEACDRRCNHYF